MTARSNRWRVHARRGWNRIDLAAIWLWWNRG